MTRFVPVTPPDEVIPMFEWDLKVHWWEMPTPGKYPDPGHNWLLLRHTKQLHLPGFDDRDGLWYGSSTCYCATLADASAKAADTLRKTREYWELRASDAKANRIVIDGHTYIIGSPGGFGGREGEIRRLGEEQTVKFGRSTGKGLWYGSEVPKAMRERLPDNAVWVSDPILPGFSASVYEVDQI